MSASPTVVWFRRNLRLEDNPSLGTALERGGPVVPLFVWSPDEGGEWKPGAASRWWLHRSLTALDESLRKKGSRLILRRGSAVTVLRELVEKTGAGTVVWDRHYEPEAAERDERVLSALREKGVRVEIRPGSLLAEPEDVATKGGDPYRVFTPFWNRLLSWPEPELLLRAPRRLPAPRRWPSSVTIRSLHLSRRTRFLPLAHERWTPGEEGALRALDRFIEKGAERYDSGRDRPDQEGTSRLSPHLHFGEVGPRQVWAALRRASRAARRGRSFDPLPFLRQIGWREFAYHLLHHYPETTDRPLRPQFDRFPWRHSSKDLAVWREGRTGYPIVDAGMRELSNTGWMHNRVRMIAASFLVKDLRISWIEGARWFWDNLVDADLANNTLGWQWVAGCGADAAPYFRVFNPVLQGKKFDPDGGYVRRWVPEIAGLPDQWIHEPWKAPADVLGEAGVTFGRTYPFPMVDHAEARGAALLAFDRIRASGKKGAS